MFLKVSRVSVSLAPLAAPGSLLIASDATRGHAGLSVTDEGRSVEARVSLFAPASARARGSRYPSAEIRAGGKRARWFQVPRHIVTSSHFHGL